MATYLELHALRSDSNLVDRVTVAVTIAAHDLINASPTASQKAWASGALANPRRVAEDLMGYLLAANAPATVENIQVATDAAIQTNVNAAVAVLSA